MGDSYRPEPLVQLASDFNFAVVEYATLLEREEDGEHIPAVWLERTKEFVDALRAVLLNRWRP